MEYIDLLFVGDTSFGENYQDRLVDKGRESILETRGYAHMLEAFTTICAMSNFTVANLETPVTDRFPSPHHGCKRYLHYADTENAPRYLEALGVDLVSLANNHTLDYGVKGLEQTLELLQARNIATCGAGLTGDIAKQPYVRRFDIGSRVIHIAILCMFEYRKKYDIDYGWYAGADKPGVNALSMKQISSTVEALKKDYENVLTIAFPHWGRNYVWATERQRIRARAMIDCGVDLVLGHGAHLLQEIERYNGRWIVYGLGNFIFGSPGRYRKNNAHPYGLIARLLLPSDEYRPTAKLRLYPIVTDNRVTNYQSRFVSEPEFQNVRALLAEHGSSAEALGGLITEGLDEHGSFHEVNLA